MKLLLCCDEYIYMFNGKYYFKNQEWCDFFYRYLRVFPQMRLVTRCKKEKTLDKNRVELNIEEIDYVPLPFFQGPKQYALKYFEIGKILNSTIIGCDCAILRLPFIISERLGKILIKKKQIYALEIVYDAEDAWKNSNSIIDRYLWKKIDENMRTLSYNVDGISCVTEYYLQKHYYSKKKGSFKNNYSSLALDKSFYSSYRKFPQNKIMTIANVANQIEFNGRKGQKEIILAVSKLKEIGIIVHVKYAGEDYNNGIAQLQELAHKYGVDKQVFFLGYLQRDKLSSFLDNADLYVMPTKAEGLPRVIIEAMAKGLPCITTNVSGNSELIESQYLVDNYYDIDSWAEKIKKITTDKELYEKASSFNFNKSLNYEASVLQYRRDTFYSKLKECVLMSKTL